MTDETARAILEQTSETAHWGFCETGVDYDDLKAMAKLWLLQGEIIKALEGEGVGGLVTAIKHHPALVAKIALAVKAELDNNGKPP